MKRSKVTAHRFRHISALLAVVLLVSCSPRSSRRPAGKVVFRQEGIASWYGGKFHGRLTASGERYNKYGISAAHRTLPLGTVVRVTHIGNGRKLTVRINDRGPFVEGRIIDLSLGAARKLDMVKEGIARVTLEAYGQESGGTVTAAPAAFSVQAGSFRVRENAEELRDGLKGSYEGVAIVDFRDKGNVYYRVRVGRYTSEGTARETAARLKGGGYRAFVIRVE
jgi:rare lipoprotein A